MGTGFDKGNFGQGTFNPKTQSGRGFNIEVGKSFSEQNFIGINAGITEYSSNLDGDPTLYSSLLYSRLVPISSSGNLNFTLGGELGRAGFARFGTMGSLRLGIIYDIPFLENEYFGVRLSILERPHFLRNKGYSEFNNNISFSVGFIF